VASPNLDTLKNKALSVSVKSVAVLNTDKTPINIPFVSRFENSTNCSVAIPATACANVE
jgi:ubiquinone biosynthesis protein UbiJ